MSLLRADARALPLRDGCVQCCVTSPPYFGLRDYGVSEQIGLEPTPDAYVAQLVAVFREVRRVLRDDGVLWLNLGDSYVSQGGLHDGREDNQRGVGAKRVWRAGSGRADGVVDERGQRNRNGNTVAGLKPKDLIGIPWRVAFALQADGWYLRSDIIWAKPNPMPESVTDRPTKAHEYVFLLTKAARYFWDAEAVKEPVAPSQVGRRRDDVIGGASWGERQQHSQGGRYRSGNTERVYGVNATSPHRAQGVPWEDDGQGRNIRSVWTIATQPYPEAHFATFPEALAERCIKAGSRPGDLVLDPFGGSGTVAQVARRLNRRAVCTELNPAYLALAQRRISEQQVSLLEASA